LDKFLRLGFRSVQSTWRLPRQSGFQAAPIGQVQVLFPPADPRTSAYPLAHPSRPKTQPLARQSGGRNIARTPTPHILLIGPKRSPARDLRPRAVHRRPPDGTGPPPCFHDQHNA
jgi:hypothetical protein